MFHVRLRSGDMRNTDPDAPAKRLTICAQQAACLHRDGKLGSYASPMRANAEGDRFPKPTTAGSLSTAAAVAVALVARAMSLVST